MNVLAWSKSEIDYGRQVVNSGLEGAHPGREMFLREKPLTPCLKGSDRSALNVAAVGACLGLLGAGLGRHKSAGRALALGVFGGAVGLSAGVAWRNRRLGAGVVAGTWKNISRARDAYWLKRHPIDYA